MEVMEAVDFTEAVDSMAEDFTEEDFAAVGAGASDFMDRMAIPSATISITGTK
jgi:hypothetical protein